MNSILTVIDKYILKAFQKLVDLLQKEPSRIAYITLYTAVPANILFFGVMVWNYSHPVVKAINVACLLCSSFGMVIALNILKNNAIYHSIGIKFSTVDRLGMILLSLMWYLTNSISVVDALELYVFMAWVVFLYLSLCKPPAPPRRKTELSLAGGAT